MMRVLAPSYRERRGKRSLLVWGDAPFWMVVDRDAERFIDRLVEGQPLASAMPQADRESSRVAAQLLTQLKRAGVAGGRPQKPPRERIESISVNVTNRCHLSCAFCYNQPALHGREELSAEAMIAALDRLRKWIAPGALLAILGGEPLMVKDKTLALAAWAKRRKLNSIVSTNGLKADREFGEQSAALGLTVQVSIDGPDAPDHDAIRGEGMFDRAVAGVRHLVGSGCRTIVSMVVHAGNAHRIGDYLRFADGLGVDEARFIPVRKLGPGGGFEPPDLVEVIRDVGRIGQHKPSLARLLGRDVVSIMAGTCRACSPRRSCGTASQTLLLDADGAIYPCPNLVGERFMAGNVAVERSEVIWHDSPVLAKVRAKVDLSAVEGCRECAVRHWCLGGCRGETVAQTGRLDQPSVVCEQMRAAVCEMFWTLAERPALGGAGQGFC